MTALHPRPLASDPLQSRGATGASSNGFPSKQKILKAVIGTLRIAPEINSASFPPLLREERLALGPGQVFWLVVRPTSHAFPAKMRLPSSTSGFP